MKVLEDVLEDVAKADRRDFTMGLIKIRDIGHHWGSITQRIRKNAAKQEEEWLGSSTSGITQIETGPDIRQYNVTLHGVDLIDPENYYLAFYGGTFQTKDEAMNAIKQMKGDLFLAVQGFNALPPFVESTWRSIEQLRLGLNPCSNCDKSHCQMRCGGCGEARYCGRKCQKEHWKKHKAQCTAVKSSRKQLKEKQKQKQRQFKEIKKQLKTPTREITSGATDAAIQSEAKKVLANMSDSSRDLVERVQMLEFFRTDEHFDAGVVAGLFPVLISLLHSDTCTGSFQLNWLSSPTQHINSTILMGVDGNCDAYRCMEFVVNHDGTWDALLKGLMGTVKRSLHETVPSQIRPVLNNNARDILRILCIMMHHPTIGTRLTIKYGQSSAPTFRSLLKMLQVSEDLDEGNGLQGLACQFAAMFHVWSEKLSINSSFVSSIGLQGMLYNQYEIMGKTMAEECIAKGRCATSEEYHEAILRKMRKLGIS